MTLAAGVPVYSRDGQRLGEVEHVLAEPEKDIFDGIVFDASPVPGGHRFVDAPEVEYWAVDRVEVGSTIATARARLGRTIAIASPVAGTVVEVNDLLDVAPHALVLQPYIRGWVARVHADNWERDSAVLLSGSTGAAQYRARLEGALARGRPAAFAGVLL